MPEGSLKILNWNLAGAKYLELPLRAKTLNSVPEKTREGFKEKLNDVLKDLIRRHTPDVITLQEVVCYEENGDAKSAIHIVDPGADYLENYDYLPHWLIDTQHHSATGKWNKARKTGGWPKDAYFAQGNAILIRRTIPYFRPFDLPAIRQSLNDKINNRIEPVKLESGLYLGDRNTEPRAALVTHLVLSQLKNRHNQEPLKRPLDIFIINLHLTTLVGEREGIPEVDEEAAQTRLRQLDIVLNGIISRYNKWAKEGFKIRGEKVDPRDGETHERHKPIWVIAGDFNFTPDSFEYQALIRRGYIDLIQNHDLGTKTSGLGENPTLTVDYVFAGPRFETIHPDVAKKGTVQNHVEITEDTRVSDHFPLVVSLPIALNEP